MPTVTSKDGTTIAYETSGQGPALILVDGALCHRAFGPMRPLGALLSPHFTVYAYDRRGRGESTDTPPYAIERELEDLQALIDAAGGSVYVYGVSSGAVLALTAGTQLPGITRLALFEPPLDDDGDRQATLAETANMKDLIAAGRRGDAVESFMSGVGTPPEAIAGMRQSPMWGMFESVAPTIVYDYTLLGDGSVPTARAASLRVPTLVMTGSETFPFIQATVQKLAQTIPNARHHVLQGQSHDAAAEAVAPVLIEFFG